MHKDSLQPQQYGKHEAFGVKLERTMQQGIVTVTAGILGESQREVGMHALIVMEWLVAQAPEAKNCGQYDHADPEPVLQGKRRVRSSCQVPESDTPRSSAAQVAPVSHHSGSSAGAVLSGWSRPSGLDTSSAGTLSARMGRLPLGGNASAGSIEPAAPSEPRPPLASDASREVGSAGVPSLPVSVSAAWIVPTFPSIAARVPRKCSLHPVDRPDEGTRRTDPGWRRHRDCAQWIRHRR